LSGKTLILKERAIRVAKKRCVKVETEKEEDTGNNVSFQRNDANIEDGDSFMAGFGSLGMKEVNSIPTERSNAKEERKADKKKRKEEKKSNARNKTKTGAKGTFIVLYILALINSCYIL
jgi:hypothetical protein